MVLQYSTSVCDSIWQMEIDAALQQAAGGAGRVFIGTCSIGTIGTWEYITYAQIHTKVCVLRST